MTRGILYYVWGSFDREELKRSARSAKLHGYDFAVRMSYDDSLWRYQKRCDIFYSTPFDITLHLDTDTLVMDNLDFGFEMAEKYALACSIAPACSAYVAKSNTLQDIMPKDLPQYSCGAFFFSREAKPVFDRWAELLRAHKKSGGNDQPFFSQAVYENINPYVLPRTWNFRPQLRYESGVPHGPIKIWHSRMPLPNNEDIPERSKKACNSGHTGPSI